MKKKITVAAVLLVAVLIAVEWDIIRFLIGSKLYESRPDDRSYGINTYDDWVGTTELLMIFRIKAMGRVQKGQGNLYGVLDREGWQTLILEVPNKDINYILYDGNDSNGIYCRSKNNGKAYYDKKAFDDIEAAVTWLKSASRYK